MNKKYLLTHDMETYSKEFEKQNTLLFGQNHNLCLKEMLQYFQIIES